MISESIFFVFFLVSLLLCAWPLGNYMNKVFAMEKTLLDPVFSPIERMVYKITGVNWEKEMNWKEYTLSLLLFHAVGLTGTLPASDVSEPVSRKSGEASWSSALGHGFEYGRQFPDKYKLAILYA